MDDTLFAALETFVAASHAPSVLPGLEAVLEGLYADSLCEGEEALLGLAEALVPHTGLSAVRAWQALSRFALCFQEERRQEVVAAVTVAPPRTAWLVTAEMARIVREQIGAEDAWRVLTRVDAVPSDEPWQDESPLVLHAILLKLRLAAETGRRDALDRLIGASSTYWQEPDGQRAVFVRIVCADHLIGCGRFLEAARSLERLRASARGDVERALLCVWLHALVACASDRHDTRLRDAIVETRERWYATPGWREDERQGEWLLPRDERLACESRFAQLEWHAGFLLEPVLPEHATSPAEALAVERAARRLQDADAQKAALASLFEDCDAILERAVADDMEENMKLRLLWARLVIDLKRVEQYEECEVFLGSVIEQSVARGLPILEMSAYDQRAVLMTQFMTPRWRDAVEDAGHAGRCATQLLAENLNDTAEDQALIVSRALLRNLLPVFDRIITLLAERAQVVEPRNGGLRDDWAPERCARWYCLGRTIHDYVERAQRLALEEARRAYGRSQAPAPHRFAMYVPTDSQESPLPHLQRMLRARDAVLQYFVMGRYLLIFAYTREQFDWVLRDMTATPSARAGDGDAHALLLRVLEGCRAWVQGNLDAVHRAAAESLHSLLLPVAIRKHLGNRRIEHLRVIPHDVLFRVPFGRLLWERNQVAERFSLSVHPTGTLAAESASFRGSHRRAKMTLAYVLGPDIGYTESEIRNIRQSVDRFRMGCRFELIDTTDTPGVEELREQLEGVDIAHFACHGSRRVRRREPSLKLGRKKLILSDVGKLNMRNCGLVVLQSCWTGWMEHERTNPVQGFPQAFHDAGVGAVIAPLVPVPQSLTPIFANAIYRALRFLPADRALFAALSVLRRHGALLASHLSDDARQDWDEYGPIDVLEYRYIGLTNLEMTGGWGRRLMGRISFWFWRWRLKRQERHHRNNKG